MKFKICIQINGCIKKHIIVAMASYFAVDRRER